MSCLRMIAGVTQRQDLRIRNKEVCGRVGLLQDAANRIQQRRMQYFGHVQRMDHTRYQNWHSTDMCMRQEDKENPRRDGLTVVKDDCKQRDLDIHQATEMTQHRSVWRSLVKLPMLASASSKSNTYRSKDGHSEQETFVHLQSVDDVTPQ